jgi:hypothetical protein
MNGLFFTVPIRIFTQFVNMDVAECRGAEDEIGIQPYAIEELDPKGDLIVVVGMHYRQDLVFQTIATLSQMIWESSGKESRLLSGNV